MTSNWKEQIMVGIKIVMFTKNWSKESNGLEINSDSEWLGIWYSTRKDKAAMKLKGKEIMKRKEDKKKNLAGNGEVSVKGRKEGKEKKKDKVMEKAKSANFTGLLLENSSTESENDNISPKYDSDDMCSINSDDDEKVRKVENVAFRAETDMDNPTFRLGMTFIDAIEFRAALRAYSIKNNKKISFKKNESDKNFCKML
ncbi:uncharacterized protein [Nicotiana tomentosiformis]|uniref:uncharacterized protein n=1 Tax=Nicotiana tomentosiformis TaxID=4098 RepID=UPI00388C53D9